MDYARTVKRYQRIGAWIGALLIGAVFLVVACLQPIDGVPGYKYVTREDPSILWGFALSFVVGAVVGAMLGIWLGARMGRKKAAQLGYSPGALWQEAAAAGAFSVPTAPSARPSVAAIEQEFGSLLAEGVFQQAEQYLSRGQQPDQEAVARRATDRAAELLMAKYGIGRAEMVRIIEQYLQKQHPV